MEQAIPLMFSAGPEAFRYVFSVKYKDQALDFLRYAFCFLRASTRQSTAKAPLKPAIR